MASLKGKEGKLAVLCIGLLMCFATESMAINTTAPTTAPTTASPTASPTTASPTASPTTASPTSSPTASPTTASPTTASPTTFLTRVVSLVTFPSLAISVFAETAVDVAFRAAFIADIRAAASEATTVVIDSIDATGDSLVSTTVKVTSSFPSATAAATFKTSIDADASTNVFTNTYFSSNGKASATSTTTVATGNATTPTPAPTSAGAPSVIDVRSPLLAAVLGMASLWAL